MAYTQTDINNIVNGILKYQGQHIAFPDGRYPGECTAPVVWYLQNMGAPVPSMADNRADGWGVSFPAALDPFFIHEPYQAGKSYPYGTLLMWNSPHIAIVLHSDGSNHVQVFEQNADPNGAVCQIFNREVNNVSRSCTYALIPRVQAPVVNPQPVCTYTIETDPNRVMQTKLNPTNWWNLNVFSGDINQFQPAATLVNGTRFPIGGYAVNQHFPQYRYAMSPEDFQRAVNSDYSTNNGINMADLEELPPPVPYTPPAAPVPVKLADKITLVTMVPTYSNELDAANRNEAKATGSFPPGEYYQFAVNDTGLLRIGLTNQAITTVWINSKDNVAPEIVPVTVVKPEPIKESELIVTKPSEVPIGKANDTTWKQSYHSYHADRSPETYELLEDYTMQDYGGSRPPINLTKGRHINVPGEFNKNGVKFYRPRDYHNDVTYQWFYGVPLFDDDGNPMMRKIVDTPPQRLSDLWHVWREDIKNYLGNKSIWDVIKKKRSK